jgi:hypothetical protein
MTRRASDGQNGRAIPITRASTTPFKVQEEEEKGEGGGVWN